MMEITVETMLQVDSRNDPDFYGIALKRRNDFGVVAEKRRLGGAQIS